MRFKELVKVDSKGRITIPLAIREAFGIHEGMNILLIADMDEKKIFISPIPNRAKLMELSIKVEDRPGVVAEISKAIADQGVDIVALKCVVIKRGELGECYIVADLSKSLITTARELKELLLKLEPVKEVEVNEIVG
ncbi:MAG: AbrB family transcriptional regulator [Desulfurococcales archaeon ex4484_58]|nr:MAG: AbrB family transcriptional regulator [Desulfurococcales archaeon ex4484_58]